MTRLISIAAGVSPELAADPIAFVESAADAGWSATGIWYDPATWSGAVTRDLARLLADTGLVPVDMEVVRMGPDGDCGDALVDAAAELGARNILAISGFDEPAATAERLAALCERAAPAGIRVCIEFMRFTTVKTLADAIHVIDLAAQPNAGILVDLIHVFRSGTTYHQISEADPGLFPYAQWCDAPADPRGWSNRELIMDALDDRAIPGAGGLPSAEFVHLFDESVPFSIEVRSAALREAFPDPVARARHLLEGTSEALGRAT